MVNTPKAYKRNRRRRQEYFAVYGEHADRHKTEPISANFRPEQQKFEILNHLHCKKKANDFPVPSRDVANQTLPGQE
jgi:hypothetical protein